MAVLFLNVGGTSLDTHHGFVVQYAMDRDLDLGEWLDPCSILKSMLQSSLLQPPPSFAYLDTFISILMCWNTLEEDET
jgi:hypothetical protein